MLLASNFLVRALCIKQLITQLVGSATIFSLNDKSNPRYRREQNKNIYLQNVNKRRTVEGIKFIYVLFECITVAILLKLTLVFVSRKTMSCKMHITHDIWRVNCL